MAHVGQKLALGAAGFLGGGLGAAQFFFGALALGDVLDGAFVIEDSAFPVADDAHVLADPDDRAVLAVDGRLEAPDGVMRVHEPDKFLASCGIDVKLAGDFLDAAAEFLDRRIAVNLRQRRVGEEVLAIRRGLKDAFDGMFDDGAVVGFHDSEALRTSMRNATRQFDSASRTWA